MVSSSTSTITLYDQDFYVSIAGYYALLETTFECIGSGSGKPSKCVFICDDDSLQLFYVLGYNNHSEIESVNCQNNNQTIDPNDEATIEMIDKLSQINDVVTAANDYLCENNDSQTFDIGYPFQVENDIINTIEGGYVCCRGFRSCFAASAVVSNLGNILCLASEACSETVLWNTDDNDDVEIVNNNMDNNNNTNATNSNRTEETTRLIDTANIFCLASSSCSDSTMKSENDIFCLAPNACDNSVILDGEKVYCTKQSCQNSKITDVDSIYLFDQQSGMTIFSNGIDIMNVYLRGLNAGTDVTVYCSTGDACTIDCGTQNACFDLDLYCLGKCTILCDETKNISCPNIISSLSPTAAPSTAPSHSPTLPPTYAPTVPPSDAPTTAPTVQPTGKQLKCRVVFVTVCFGAHV